MRTSTQPDLIGPPPKFHELRDNLPRVRRRASLTKLLLTRLLTRPSETTSTLADQGDLADAAQSPDQQGRDAAQHAGRQSPPYNPEVAGSLLLALPGETTPEGSSPGDIPHLLLADAPFPLQAQALKIVMGSVSSSTMFHGDPTNTL